MSQPHVPVRVVNEDVELPDCTTLSALLSANEGQLRLIAPETWASTDVEDLAQIDVGEPLPAWWHPGANLQRAGVTLYKMTDAVVFPGTGVIMSADGRIMSRSFAEAAFFLGTPSRLPGAIATAEGTVEFDLSVPVHLDEDVIVSMPWGGLGNYGHFMLDCLPTLAVCRQFPELDEWIRMFPPLKSWQTVHLALIGVDGVVPHEAAAYRVPAVIWSNVMDHFLHAPGMPVLLVRDVQKLRRTEGGLAAADRKSRIWVSRSGFARRRYGRETELEDAVERRGFSVFKPEQMSVLDQMHAFEHASVVAGFTGAALANVLYMERSATVVEIMPEHRQEQWVRQLASLVGSRWRPFFCRATVLAAPIPDGQKPPELHLDIDLPLDAFLAYLDRIT